MTGLIRSNGDWWIRIGDWVLSLTDHRVIPALFSERHGITKHLHIGPYCLKLHRHKVRFP